MIIAYNLLNYNNLHRFLFYLISKLFLTIVKDTLLIVKNTT